LAMTVLGCLKIESEIVCEALPDYAPQNAPVMPGLDPGIHQSSSQVFRRWITGSSPVTTISIGMKVIARSGAPGAPTTGNPGRFTRPGLLESECKVQINIRRR
ncbi:MAG TPA: hypothetical protein VN831_09545, partial [Bradyrhizobium sp.]|nr:hypothetical protein [Bradyrhizobium sp.]